MLDFATCKETNIQKKLINNNGYCRDNDNIDSKE